MKAKFVRMHSNNSEESASAGNDEPKSSNSKRQQSKKAVRLFLEGVRVRGEAAAPDAEGKLPPGALFEEDEAGLLTRSRFSLV